MERDRSARDAALKIMGDLTPRFIDESGGDAEVQLDLEDRVVHVKDPGAGNTTTLRLPPVGQTAGWDYDITLVGGGDGTVTIANYQTPGGNDDVPASFSVDLTAENDSLVARSSGRDWRNMGGTQT